MDQATDEQRGDQVNELLLPACELDLAFVLLAGPVLGKQAGPGLRVSMNLDVVLWSQLSMDSVPRNDGFHRGSALGNDFRIFLVECDSQSEDVSGALRDASVSEIEAE
jgi:hypothetical protein